jgi:hypothetical protein
MTNNTQSWPCNQLDRTVLTSEIGKFLRSHSDGFSKLIELLHSVPPDRTEEEFTQLVRLAAEKHEAGVQEVIDRINRRQAQLGLPPIDRQGRLVRARNPGQSESAAALCDRVRGVMHQKGAGVSAKEVLRALGVPDSKRRAVSRCLAKLRGRKVAKRRAK